MPRKQPRQVLKRINNARLNDIISLMIGYFPLFVDQTEHIAPAFKGNSSHETGLNVFNFIRSFNYKADKLTQQVKTPYRLMMDNEGDCKSFSIFAASILYNLGYDVKFKYVAGKNADQPDHVFVIYSDGAKIHKLDATIDNFDTEPFFLNSWTYSPTP